MNKTKIDHITVGTNSLDADIEAMQVTLGVSLSQSSKHDLMSIQNCVMQIGNTSFFELITVDPPIRAVVVGSHLMIEQRMAQRPRALC